MILDQKTSVTKDLPSLLKTSYRNRKWNHLNRKWNYFSYFQTSDQKTSFKKDFPSLPRTPKPFLETENQTGNGIISPISRPRIKKISIFTEDTKMSFGKLKWNYINRKWKYFSYLLASGGERQNSCGP